jgi:GT2 family glycosyltransferase
MPANRGPQLIDIDTSVSLANLSIVLLSYNRREVLERNVTALSCLSEKTGCEVIVVDNASTDGSAEFLANALTRQANMHLIANSSNTGVASGRNAGWHAANREFILNIDDDTVISVDAITSMLAVMAAKRCVGIISPQIRHAATGITQLWFEEPTRRLSNFHGACHLIRRNVIEKIGFNDEDCSFGGEELDLSIRAWAAGFEVLYVGKAVVLHDSLIHTGNDGRWRRERWLYNFIRVHQKHFPIRTAVPFSLRFLASNLISARGAFGPVFLARMLRAAVCGFFDGRRAHKLVPPHVVNLYRRVDLQPEFGNVPLLTKLRRKISERKYL